MTVTMVHHLRAGFALFATKAALRRNMLKRAIRVIRCSAKRKTANAAVLWKSNRLF